MADVLVSHARSDKALVAPLVAAIETGLWAARAVLVVWTPASVTSPWFRGEARILSEGGRHDAASAEIEAARALDPESYEVNRAAACLRLRQKRPEDAVRHFEKARSLMETDLSSVNMLMTSGTAPGDREAAQRTARLIDPDNMSMRCNFARTVATPLKDADGALGPPGPLFEKVSIGLLHHAKDDPDMDSLRIDPRFAAVAATAEARLEVATGGAGSAVPQA